MQQPISLHPKGDGAVPATWKPPCPAGEHHLNILERRNGGDDDSDDDDVFISGSMTSGRDINPIRLRSSRRRRNFEIGAWYLPNRLVRRDRRDGAFVVGTQRPPRVHTLAARAPRVGRSTGAPRLDAIDGGGVCKPSGYAANPARRARRSTAGEPPARDRFEPSARGGKQGVHGAAARGPYRRGGAARRGQDWRREGALRAACGRCQALRCRRAAANAPKPS